MKIAITGYNGFIGSNLVKTFENEGNSVIKIERYVLLGDQERLIDYIEKSDVLVHLSGAPVMTRWTRNKKKIIRNSRVETGERLYQALKLAIKKPDIVFLSSGKDIYSKDCLHDEKSTNFRNGFIGELVRDWEIAGRRIESLGIRTIIMRFGIILGKNGGALKKMSIPFKIGLGATLAGGSQIMPFMHINDLVGSIKYLIGKSGYSGIVNFVSPEVVNNRQFSETITEILNRPLILNIPGFIIRAVYGEAAILILEGQQVEPGVLKEIGYKFKFPTLRSALKEALN